MKGRTGWGMGSAGGFGFEDENKDILDAFDLYTCGYSVEQIARELGFRKEEVICFLIEEGIDVKDV